LTGLKNSLQPSTTLHHLFLYHYTFFYFIIFILFFNHKKERKKKKKEKEKRENRVEGMGGGLKNSLQPSTLKYWNINFGKDPIMIYLVIDFKSF
jgi:hypothetical protein